MTTLLNKDFASVVSQCPDRTMLNPMVIFSPDTTIPEIFDLNVGGYVVEEDSYDTLIQFQPDRTSMVCYFNPSAGKENFIEFLQAAWNNPHIIKVVDNGVGDDLLDQNVVFFDRNADRSAPGMKL